MKLYAIMKLYKDGYWRAIEYASRPSGLRKLKYGEKYGTAYSLDVRITLKGWS